LLQIAREASQTAVYQLNEYEPALRHGTLVTLLLETEHFDPLELLADHYATLRRYSHVSARLLNGQP
jgi:hypothetical protein